MVCPNGRVFDLFAKISLDTSEYESGLNEASNKTSSFGDSLKSIGSSVSSVGKTLTLGVTTPIVGIGTAIVKTGANFEAGMSQVAATMGTTSDSIQDLSDFALEMGSTTSFSAIEAADGLNILAMSGLDANEQMSALPQVLDLAAAGNLSLANSATYVTGAVKGFSDSMDNSQYYADLMAKGATLANTSVAALGEALSGGAATAASYGQTAEGTTLSLLRLAEQNVTGSEAATALNRAMADLYTPTSSAKKLLDELGVATYDSAGNTRDFNTVVDELSDALSGMSQEEANAYASTIFTTYGLQAFNKMTVSSKETVESFRDGLENSFGSAAEQAATQLANLNGSFTIMQSALEGLSISLSQFIIPAVTDFVKWLTEVITAFNSLDDGTKKVILTIAGIAAVVGPILIVIGKIITAIGTIGGAIGGLTSAIGGAGTAVSGLFSLLAANPIALVVAGVAALVAAFVLLWNNCEGFREFWLGLWESLKEAASNFGSWISEKMSEIVEWVKEKWEGIGEFFAGVWEGIQSVFSSVAEFFGNVFQAAAELIQAVWNGVVEFFSGVWEEIQSVFSTVAEVLGGLFEAAAQAVQTAWETVVDFFSGVWEGIQAAFSTVAEVLGGFFQAAWDAIVAVWQAAGEWFGAICEAIQAVFEAVTKAISDLFQEAGEFVKKAWEGIRDFFTELGDKVRGIWEEVTSFIQEVFEAAAEAVRSAWESVKEFFSDIWNSIKETAENTTKAVGEAFKSAWETVKSAWDSATEFFQGILDKIVGVFKNIGSKFKEIGSNIVNGLKEGITNAWNSFISWLGGKISGIVDSVKGLLGIHSPSTVFAGIGGNMALGLAEGWDDEYSAVKRKIENGMDFQTTPLNFSATGTVNNPNAYSPAGGFSGGNTFNFTFNSPKAMDPVEAAKEAKKAAQRIALGVV